MIQITSSNSSCAITIPGSNLCATCAEIDVSELLASIRKVNDPTPPPQPDAIGHELLSTVLSRCAECSLCRLIAHSIHTNLRVNQSKTAPDPSVLPDEAELQPYFAPKSLRQLRVSLQRRNTGNDIVHVEGLKRNGFTFQRVDNTIHWRVYRMEIHLLEEEEEDANIGATGSEAARPKKKPRNQPSTSAEGYLHQLMPLSEEAKLQHSQETVLQGRMVPAQVNISRILKWIEICSQTHFQCKRSVWGKGLPEPEDITVIDTKEWRVCKARKGCRYITLSYVWGGDQKYRLLSSNKEAWMKPNGLPALELFPRSIRDAMILVKRLGERYLWVDALCIVQDEKEEQMTHIQQMDRIYGASWLTVVAAKGINADAGLPGLEPNSRQPTQLVANVQGIRVAVPLPSIPETARSSYWNTRAWTYQEQVLSCRTLYFTAHQVYFQCEARTFCEDVYGEIPGPDKSANSTMLPYNGFQRVSFHPPEQALDREGYRRWDPSIIEEYQLLVWGYTTRRMTNSDDALNAFLGISNRLKSIPANRGFVAGMSVFAFDNVLLWMPMAPPIRRKTTNIQLPTWSWAAWECPTKVELFAQNEYVDPVITEIFVHTPAGIRYRFPQFIYTEVYGATRKMLDEEFKDHPFWIVVNGENDKDKKKNKRWWDRSNIKYKNNGDNNNKNNKSNKSNNNDFIDGNITALSSMSQIQIRNDLMLSHTIEFRSWTASLYLNGEANSTTIFYGFRADGFSQASVFTENGVWCGTLRILTSELEEIKKSGERLRVEFVLISKRFLPDKQFTDPEAWKESVVDRRHHNTQEAEAMNVLAVKRTEKGLERWAVGTIHQAAWREAGPVEELVFLV